MVSVVFQFFNSFITTKPQERKRFIFGLIHFCIGFCGLSHNLIISKVAVYVINWLLWNHQRKIDFWINQYQYWCLWSFIFLQSWKTLQWVCGSPGTELLFFVCVQSYTKPRFCGLSFLFNVFHQHHKPQERTRCIFGLINVGFGVCGLSFFD